MLDKSVIQRFNNYRNIFPSRNSIFQLREYLNFYMPILKSLADKYEVQDAKELKDTLGIFLQNIYDSFSKYSYIDSDLYELQAMDSLLKDPSYITQEYPALKGKPNTQTVYTSNLARSKKLALINAINEIVIIEETAQKLGITSDADLRKLPTDNIDPKDKKLFFSVTSKVFSKRTPTERLIEIIKAGKAFNENRIKTMQISFLESLARFFSNFGLLESYLTQYENGCRKAGLSSLKYDYSTLSYDRNSLGLEESLSEDFLKTLDVEDLCFLTTFWCNRFAHEIEHMNIAFSAINSMDLWQDIIDGKKTFNISDDALIAVIRKTNYISDLISESYMLHHKGLMAKKLQQGSNFSGDFSKDYTNYYNHIDNQIGSTYTSYFSKILDGDNDFWDDVMFSSQLVELKTFAYHKKSTTLEPIVKGLLDNPHLKNWGIIREEILDNGTFLDSINHGKAKILLGFDIEGFNRPFRFHVIKEDIMDLLKVNGLSYIIPEYQGGKDFVVNKQLVSSSIIMPIPKRHRDTIRSNAQSGPNKDLWEHMYYLTNGKFPQHLMQQVKAGSNTKPTLSRLPIIYTDLSTGKRYFKVQNSYVEVGEDNVR